MITTRLIKLANALNRSEGFLVSDKIMGLAGESMRDFRNKLINEPPPKIVKHPIIPPKAIKRGKSSEGSELCEGKEMD